jgi:hypothetical protein
MIYHIETVLNANGYFRDDAYDSETCSVITTYTSHKRHPCHSFKLHNDIRPGVGALQVIDTAVFNGIAFNFIGDCNIKKLLRIVYGIRCYYIHESGMPNVAFKSEEDFMRFKLCPLYMHMKTSDSSVGIKS